MLVIQRPTVEALGEEADNRQRFAVGPLEPGFGHTLGNSLRRTLLSSIPGAAITMVRFDDALHEFDTITGVAEDVTDIILNLKDIVLTSTSDEPVTCASTPAARPTSPPATSSARADVEILNKDLHIATLNAKGRLAIDLTVERGRGYLSSDRETRPHDRRRPDRRDLLAGPPGDVRGRADPRRAVHELRPPGPRHRDRRFDHARATRWPRPAPRCARWSTSSPTCPTSRRASSSARSPTPRASSPDLDLPDRGPRPVRASPQLPQAGPDQHRRRAAHQDRGRPAEHHQLRPEEPRRGQGQARRARPDAARLSRGDDRHAQPHAAPAASAAPPRTSA